MNIFNDKLTALNNKLQRHVFNWKCGSILNSTPLSIEKDKVIILSMLRHPDVMMYLVAVKSFYQRFQKGEMVILNDGSLTAKDIDLLKHQVSPKDIVHINDIDNSICPKGGCWERILLISEYVKDYFVIQLDADTLTQGDVPEVQHMVNGKTCFTLPTKAGQAIEKMDIFLEKIKKRKDKHIQLEAEKSFCKLPRYDHLKYVRGSAAFAGFSPGSFSRSSLESFSLQMADILGTSWNTWGTEQVTSNYLIANSPQADMLPFPKYSGFFPPHQISYDDSSFLHFAGHHRWANHYYLDSALKLIKALSFKQVAS